MKTKEDKMFNLLYTLTKLHQSGLGVFQLNKLAFLYEYFHIKNFGERYTFDRFIKLPHGPVITNYKNTIKKAAENTVLDADIHAIWNNNGWQNHSHTIQIIRPGRNLLNAGINTEAQYNLAIAVIKKFADMKPKDLEKFVYSTQPVKRFLELEAAGHKYTSVLRGDVIKLKDYKSDAQKGMKRYHSHIEKYPTVNWKLQNKFFEELRWLEKYRPGINE